MSFQRNVEKLSRQADKTFSNLESEREREARILERKNEIDKAPERSVQDFWCELCRLDFTRVGHKFPIWSYTVPVAKYEAKCPKCEKVCIRRITDKSNDPYWNQSQKIAEDRKRERIAMLQPGQAGFQTYYGDPYAKQNKEREQQEREEYERTHQVHKYFKD